MADKTTLNRAFNSHFFEFLEDIIEIYPDNDDIAGSKTSFTTIRKANPTAIIKAWYKYVYEPYRQPIDAGDITFFFDKDYSKDLGNLSNANEIMKVIDKIREPIRNMSDENKSHCMDYIKNLCKVSLAYASQ